MLKERQVGIDVEKTLQEFKYKLEHNTISYDIMGNTAIGMLTERIATYGRHCCICGFEDATMNVIKHMEFEHYSTLKKFNDLQNPEKAVIGKLGGKIIGTDTNERKCPSCQTSSLTEKRFVPHLGLLQSDHLQIHECTNCNEKFIAYIFFTQDTIGVMKPHIEWYEYKGKVKEVVGQC